MIVLRLIILVRYPSYMFRYTPFLMCGFKKTKGCFVLSRSSWNPLRNSKNHLCKKLPNSFSCSSFSQISRNYNYLFHTTERKILITCSYQQIKTIPHLSKKKLKIKTIPQPILLPPSSCFLLSPSLISMSRWLQLLKRS